MQSSVVSSHVAVSHVAVSHVAVFLAVDEDTVRVRVGVIVRRLTGETATRETATWTVTVVGHA